MRETDLCILILERCRRIKPVLNGRAAWAWDTITRARFLGCLIESFTCVFPVVLGAVSVGEDCRR